MGGLIYIVRTQEGGAYTGKVEEDACCKQEGVVLDLEQVGDPLLTLGGGGGGVTHGVGMWWCVLVVGKNTTRSSCCAFPTPPSFRPLPR
jgi:hypothetical protein